MDAATIYARRWWTLAVLCLSLLITGLDNTILNVALPTLIRDLHATSSNLEWIVDSYTLVYASLLLTTGSLGDRYGRKRALTVGLAVFAAGSVFAAFSGSAPVLIAARAIMGVGGCLIMPATLSILTNVFPAGERAKAIGIWSGVAGLGIVIGPVTGGYLLRHFWWGSVFLINVPVVALALLAGRRFVPESRDPEPSALDPMGTALSAAGLATLLYGIIEVPTRTWANAGIRTAFAAGVVLLIAFVFWELRSSHPMLDVRFFENPRFTAASLAITLVFFALFGVSFFLTQFLQFVLGYTPLAAGLAFSPIAVVMMVASVSSGILTGRLGNKVMVSAGLLFVALSLILLSLASVHTTYLTIALVVSLMGFGMGTAMSPATESIMGSLPLAKAGVGSAVNDTTRQIGGALGVAVLGSITAAAYRHAMSSGSVLAAIVSPAARAGARDSLGGALVAARRLGGTAGAALAADGKSAFVHAMTSTVRIGAAVALAGALIALVFLPSRAASPLDRVLPSDDLPTEVDIAAAADAV